MLDDIEIISLDDIETFDDLAAKLPDTDIEPGSEIGKLSKAEIDRILSLSQDGLNEEDLPEMPVFPLEEVNQLEGIKNLSELDTEGDINRLNG